MGSDTAPSRSADPRERTPTLAHAGRAGAGRDSFTLTEPRYGTIHARMSGEREQAEARMRAAGQPEEAIRSFDRAYERLVAGESTMLRSADLEPVADVAMLAALPAADAASALARLAVIKLNGGLATTMGVRGPSRSCRRSAGTRSSRSSSGRRWRCGGATRSACRSC